MSVVVGILVVIGLVAVAVYLVSQATERPSDPDDQPDVSGDHRMPRTGRGGRS
ncbi:MAG TPA: hypothetical protein VD926_07065 [Acidimicrobiales bacterium]|nr:hypothetical protein [Acidimicrobiales bacterium]